MLPNDPPDGNDNNPTPPPFGSNFNPHTNPIDPNNPYSSQPPPPPQPPPVTPPNPSIPPQNPPIIPNNPNDPDSLKHAAYSEVAKHKMRDHLGRFIHSEYPTPPNPSVPPNPSSLPPIIEINKDTKSSQKYPPLFGFFLTNPVTYLRIFLNKLIKRQAVTLRIPVLAILIIAVGVGSYGAGVKTGINYALGKLFPNFSPLLHRSITAQGIIQKSSKGYYLQANDKDKTLWNLKPISANINLSDYDGQRVQIRGNLTPTPNLIEVSEVISFDTKPTN